MPVSDPGLVVLGTYNPFLRIPCSLLMHDSYQPTNVNSRCISMHLVSTAIDHKQARLPRQPQPQRHQQRRGENFQRTHHRRRRRPRPRRPGRPEARLLLRLPQGRREPGREGPGRGLRLADQRNVRTYDRHYQRMTSQPPLSLFLGSVGDDVYKFIVVDYCSSPIKHNMCSGRNPSLCSTVFFSPSYCVFFSRFRLRRGGGAGGYDLKIHSFIRRAHLGLLLVTSRSSSERNQWVDSARIPLPSMEVNACGAPSNNGEIVFPSNVGVKGKRDGIYT